MQIKRRKPNPSDHIGQIKHAIKVRPRKEQELVDMLWSIYRLESTDADNLIYEMCYFKAIVWDKERKLYVLPG